MDVFDVGVACVSVGRGSGRGAVHYNFTFGAVPPVSYFFVVKSEGGKREAEGRFVPFSCMSV